MFEEKEIVHESSIRIKYYLSQYYQEKLRKKICGENMHIIIVTRIQLYLLRANNGAT